MGMARRSPMERVSRIPPFVARAIVDVCLLRPAERLRKHGSAPCATRPGAEGLLRLTGIAVQRAAASRDRSGLHLVLRAGEWMDPDPVADRIAMSACGTALAASRPRADRNAINAKGLVLRQVSSTLLPMPIMPSLYHRRYG